jgi:hypothetical protein
MKNNAGILLTHLESMKNYSNDYLSAFEKSEMYFGWESWGGVYRTIQPSHDYIKNVIAKSNDVSVKKSGVSKQLLFNNPPLTEKYAGMNVESKLQEKTVNQQTKNILWSSVLDVYHYVYNQIPWTHALQGKTLLIISSMIDSIQEQIPKRSLIYGGVDLFPDCKFIFLKPPITHGQEQAEEYSKEMEKFKKRVNELDGCYDVALVSCGGYANPICSHIYDRGHSSIYVGGVLQMFFGILGKRWLVDRPDIIRLFMNEHWTQPKDNEKPIGYQNVEGGCYY